MMHSNQAEADLKEENKANTPNNDALVAQFCIDEMSRPCPPCVGLTSNRNSHL